MDDFDPPLSETHCRMTYFAYDTHVLCRAETNSLRDVIRDLTAALAAESGRCAKIAEAWADHYPEDVFPPVGSTGRPALIDQIAAQASRRSAKHIAAQIREPKEPPEQECGA